ncbi:MAG: HAMP domain-containing sensor histidine kinase [Bacteroidales bacterium]
MGKVPMPQIEKDYYTDISSLEQLQLWKSKLEFAIKSFDAMIWEYDIDNNLFFSEYSNSALIGGLTFEEYINIHHKDDRLKLRKSFSDLMHDNIDNIALNLRLKQKNGSYVWINIHGKVFQRNKNGAPTRIIGLRQTIQEQVEQHIELLNSKRKLEEYAAKIGDASNLKTAFFANMSHEIRTPLNAIVGFSNLIIDAVKDNEALVEYGKVIETNNNLLIQLVNDVLDMAKIEAGKLEFNMSEICVNELMNQLQQMFQMRVQNGVKVILDIPTTEYYIKSERTRLTQVITNFLSNAVKFTSNGFITVGYSVSEQGLYFYVSDTGKGIMPENISHVFDRFTKFDREVQGSGLGLSISQTIIKSLGGEIGVESKFGEGTKFWFTLPCLAYSL